VSERRERLAWGAIPDWLRRHRRLLLRALPAVGVAVALLVLVVRNADLPELPDYEVPEGFTPAPPPTTAAPGAARPSLAAVGGTTTSTVPPNVGRARIAGVVNGPQGPVPGAMVRLERAVGGETQVLDLQTGPDGRYDAAGIGGGRYRVRAFLPPTLAQPTGEVLFLRADEDRALDLAVEAFGEPSLSLAFAPDPPLLDQAVNVAVRVTGRLVDPDGVVRTSSVAGAVVSVGTSGGMTPTSSSSASTDGDGQARFTYRCEAAVETRLQVTARLPAALVAPPPTAPPDTTDPTATTATTAPAAAPVVTTVFDLPACVDPATLTTTTTVPPDGDSTTSTSAPPPSTTTATTQPEP
jgi:hypothetical protein